MNVINNQCIISQIPLNLKNIVAEAMSLDSIDLCIPLNLSAFDTSSIDIALSEENELYYGELIGACKYQMSCDITNNTPSWYLTAYTDDYATPFPIELDEGEEVLLMYSMMQYSILSWN